MVIFFGSDDFNMKAIILAAGMGTRLGKYTKNLPKGMLSFAGKPLLKRQIDVYRKLGIEEIVVVTGYKSETINFTGVLTVHNNKFDSTNMVYSLMCAEKFLSGELLVSYSDLLLSEEVVSAAMNFKGELGVVVDRSWKDYWSARYGKLDFDTESLRLASDGSILSLGKPNESHLKIDARYVGLLKFSGQGILNFKSVYSDILKNKNNASWRYSKNVVNAYMTDVIQEMIERGEGIKTINVNGGWLEFDTNDDYELYNTWLHEGVNLHLFDFSMLQ